MKNQSSKNSAVLWPSRESTMHLLEMLDCLVKDFIYKYNYSFLSLLLLLALHLLLQLKVNNCFFFWPTKRPPHAENLFNMSHDRRQPIQPVQWRCMKFYQFFSIYFSSLFSLLSPLSWVLIEWRSDRELKVQGIDEEKWLQELSRMHHETPAHGLVNETRSTERWESERSALLLCVFSVISLQKIDTPSSSTSSNSLVFTFRLFNYLSIVFG